VKFIDYGQISEVSELAKLPEALHLIPTLAVRVDLGADIPEDRKEKLEELVMGIESPLTLVEENNVTVDVLLNGLSLSAQLLGLYCYPYNGPFHGI